MIQPDRSSARFSPLLSPLSHAPGVSVVIPVLNGSKTISECLQSLVVQDYPEKRYEIIVVDNGSTDDTTDLVHAFRSRVILLDEPMPGPGAARNTGVRAARHDLIAFTDADCFPILAWLRCLVEHKRAHPDTDFVGGPILAQNPACPAQRYAERLFDQQESLTRARWPYAITANLLIPKERLYEFGLFDHTCRLGEDVDLSYRAALNHGATFAFARQAMVRHANPATKRALFRKGLQHGWGAALLHRKYGQLLPQSRFGRCLNLRTYRNIIVDFFFAARALIPRVAGRSQGRPGAHQTRLFNAIFRSGKQLAFVAGTLATPCSPSMWRR